jgi:hypothetical protein
VLRLEESLRKDAAVRKSIAGLERRPSSPDKARLSVEVRPAYSFIRRTLTAALPMRIVAEERASAGLPCPAEERGTNRMRRESACSVSFRAASTARLILNEKLAALEINVPKAEPIHRSRTSRPGILPKLRRSRVATR